jgi:hypothetical protein
MALPAHTPLRWARVPGLFRRKRVTTRQSFRDPFQVRALDFGGLPEAASREFAAASSCRLRETRVDTCQSVTSDETIPRSLYRTLRDLEPGDRITLNRGTQLPRHTFSNRRHRRLKIPRNHTPDVRNVGCSISIQPFRQIGSRSKHLPRTNPISPLASPARRATLPGMTVSRRRLLANGAMRA